MSLGSLLDINIENLQEQSLSAAESKAEHANDGEQNQREVGEIATVAVVSGAGLVKVYEGLGVSAIVLAARR